MQCGKFEIDALIRDRDQLWAEACYQYKAGEVWWLDTEELNALAAAEQDKRYDTGLWDNEILEWAKNPKQRYETDGGAQLPIEPFDSSVGCVTVSDVLRHGIGKPLDRCTQADKMQVVRCLVHAGWKRKQIRIGDNRKWFYVQVTPVCHHPFHQS